MSDVPSIADLTKSEVTLQQQLATVRRDKIRAEAKQRRAGKPINAVVDKAMADIFSTTEGRVVLVHFQDVRPIVADEIQEAIDRVKPVPKVLTDAPSIADAGPILTP